MTKNTIKETPPEEQKPKQKSSGANIVTRTVGSVMSGAFLSRESTLRTLPFIFFLTFIALLYIANGYYAEEQIRKLNTLTNDIKELRSEYIDSKSDLSCASQRSPIVARAQALGLKDSVGSLLKIEVKVLPAPKTEN
ncbi:MAG: hypothetical protein HY064_16945 [Bacteroidetes bacterium]|nr:hypothetical protein [Bacteroidota bacterium]